MQEAARPLEDCASMAQFLDREGGRYAGTAAGEHFGREVAAPVANQLQRFFQRFATKDPGHAFGVHAVEADDVLHGAS